MDLCRPVLRRSVLSWLAGLGDFMGVSVLGGIVLVAAVVVVVVVVAIWFFIA